jgi:N-acetylglutamate synthase-like GNAT family acetyltransferase
MKIRNATIKDFAYLLKLVKDMRKELKDENYKVVDFHLSIIEKNLGLYLAERNIRGGM